MIITPVSGKMWVNISKKKGYGAKSYLQSVSVWANGLQCLGTSIHKWELTEQK